MHDKPRGWVIRSGLAAALVAVLFVGWLLQWPTPPATWLVAFAALALMTVGLVWIIRIARGPRDEPPPWRYRDG